MTDERLSHETILRFRAVTEAGDVDGLMPLIHPDADLVSPIFGRLVIRGQRDLGTLFRAVYSSVDIAWKDQVADERLALLRGETRIAGVRVDDAMVLELGPDGLIHRIRPHLRPWLGLTAFALIVGSKLARHPGFFVRALRPRL